MNRNNSLPPLNYYPQIPENFNVNGEIINREDYDYSNNRNHSAINSYNEINKINNSMNINNNK